MIKHKSLTVGELRKALEGVPDNLIVELSSDTGVDQGSGAIVVEQAYRSTYQYGDTTNLKVSDTFKIYCNDRDDWCNCDECAFYEDCADKEGVSGCFMGIQELEDN